MDWPVRLVEQSPELRRALAFPVAFASSANWLASCIYVAAKLKLPDELASGAKTVRELADSLNCDGPALGRLLRSLSGQGPIPGLFIEIHDTPFAPLPLLPPLGNFFARPPSGGELSRRYALTPMGAMLREQGTGSLRPWVIFNGEELGKAWSGLQTAVEKGKPNFGGSQAPEADGMSFWEYLAENPDKRVTFDNSMQALSFYSAEEGAAADSFDWSAEGRKWIVDVGGGTGALIASILDKHPTLKGTLFDQEEVVSGAPAVLSAKGVADRCEIKSGSFFEAESIPQGADVYLMKNILHDWADPEAVAILQQTRAAMRRDSRLVILEIVCSERAAHEPWNLDFSDFYDLNMLVTVGGKERSRTEWEALLASADMRLVEVQQGKEWAWGNPRAGAPCAIVAAKK